MSTMAVWRRFVKPYPPEWIPEVGQQVAIHPSPRGWWMGRVTIVCRTCRAVRVKRLTGPRKRGTILLAFEQLRPL